jgi:hypothetical protein
MNQRKANLVARVVLGTMPRVDSFVPFYLSGHKHSLRRLSNARRRSTDEKEEKGGEDAGPATSKSARNGKVQENSGSVAEEKEKTWKSQEEKDDLLTFKDASLDISKRAHPSGDE